MADINILEGNEVVATTGLSDINGNFTELNIKKIELEGLTTEMLDTDYFTIKKDDGKFYLITKADADLGGGAGSCGYTEAGNVVNLTFLNGSNNTHTKMDTDGTFYIAKQTTNFDTNGESIFLLKMDSNFNIIQHSLIRYSPTVGNKGIGLAGLDLFNGEIVLTGLINTNSLNPVAGSVNGSTGCFIRIDKSNLNIIGDTTIILTTGSNRSLTPYLIYNGGDKLGFRVSNGSSFYIGTYSGTGTISLYMVNGVTNTVSYLFSGINDMICFQYSSPYKYFFLSTLSGLTYTTNNVYLSDVNIENDGSNYYVASNGQIYKLNGSLEPLLNTKINYGATELIFDIIYYNNKIYVLSVAQSNYGTPNLYLHIFNSSDLTFYKKILINNLLSTGSFPGGGSLGKKLFIKDGYIYICFNNYNNIEDLRIFKIGLDPANGDYLTQPAKKTNMYNIIVDQMYNPEEGTTLTKSTNITNTLFTTMTTIGNLGSPGLANTSGSISQVKLWVGI